MKRTTKRHTKRATGIIATFVVGILLALGPALAQSDGESGAEAARAVAQELIRESHAAMTAEGLDEAARMARVEEAVSEAFAFDIWERFLVGQRDLTEAERATFRELLPGFLAGLYAERFGKGLAGAPEITGTRTVRRDVLVDARIPRAEGPALPVTYRMREIEGKGYRIIDIMVGGVSFLLLKRDEFGALIEQKGVEGLLAHMRGQGG